MMSTHDQAAVRPRSMGRAILAILGLLLIVLFAGLGTWQVYRLQWKLALIERVESRVGAAPVSPPPPSRWAQVTKDSDEYRHVRVSGHFLYEYTTPVQAVSELGAGFWLLTPLCTTDGAVVLVNRGFVPASGKTAQRYPARRADGNPCATASGPAHTLTGLLRIAEPGGGFLRDNDPVRNRWFSRDVAAIAAARGLSGSAADAAPPVAPFFVDAARGQDPAGAPDRPVGGLTVISFQNNHLVYAVTWYALALMVAGAWWYVARFGAKGERSQRPRNDGSKA
ncbi:MAG: SURF1 family protein [Pseudomonadota bacterium]